MPFFHRWLLKLPQAFDRPRRPAAPVQSPTPEPPQRFLGEGRSADGDIAIDEILAGIKGHTGPPLRAAAGPVFVLDALGARLPLAEPLQKEEMDAPDQIFKLRLDSTKTVEAIDFLAREWPGITIYFLGKVLYFADRDHCLDWGRTITGDRYIALEHGPVPSRVYDLLKAGSGEDDEILDAISSRLSFEADGNKIRVHSKHAGGFDALSESDIACLTHALGFCSKLSFAQLRNLARAELPWQKAFEGDSSAPPMDLTLWFQQANLDRKAAGVYLREHAARWTG